VRVEVLLEVEVGQLVLRLEAEESQELRIRVDVALVHQVVLLDVARDELRDVRAALRGAGRAAEERAERRRDRRRHLEEADARRLALLALRRRLAATALVGNLLNLGRRLLQALGLADELREILAHLDQARRQRLDLGLQLLLLNLLRDRRSRRGRDSRNRRDLGLLGGLLGLRRSGRRSRHSRRHSGRRRGLANNLRGGRRGGGGDRGSSDRGSLLGGTLGRLGRGGAHNTSGGDRRRGHFTQDLLNLTSQPVNFWHKP